MLFLLACTVSGTLRTAAEGPGDSGVDSAGDSVRDSGLDSATDGALDSVDPGDSGAWTLPERPDTDDPPTTASWRGGGGADYPDAVDPEWPVVTVVSTLAELQAAVGAAGAGSIVYVANDAEIDLTGTTVCLPAGAWLAGGRGIDGARGGLLFATRGASTAIVTTCGADVRVTGLRILGPDPETCPPEWPSACPNDVSDDSNCAYCTDTAYGISTTYDGLEVDNNELSGWTYAAVGVKNAVDADVHHNWIHHGWREGLGYGVVIYGQEATRALVRWNRFDAMRHVVAGQGYPLEDYEARDNLVESAAISDVFDMHGEDEVEGNNSSSAGGDIRVHGNVVLVDDQYSLVVRGRPDTGAWLYDNCLAPAESAAYDQRYYSGNFHVDVSPSGSAAPNAYGQSPGDCGTLHGCLADDATGPLRYGSASGTGVASLLVGDMDGDGRDDVFESTGSAWRFANPDGGSWASLATSSVSLGNLALADLDGDGTDDVFYADGSRWYWSRSGTTSWAELRESAYGRDQVLLGDFDGDGADDVFVASGSRWYFYPRGSGEAVALASASARVSDLALGDFDGDGIADVFYGSGSQWYWSRSGSSSYAALAASSAVASELRFADLDGDGRTDVILEESERLRVSWSGASSWVTVRYQRGDFLLGDFGGDGVADVMRADCL